MLQPLLLLLVVLLLVLLVVVSTTKTWSDATFDRFTRVLFTASQCHVPASSCSRLICRPLAASLCAAKRQPHE